MTISVDTRGADGVVRAVSLTAATPIIGPATKTSSGTGNGGAGGGRPGVAGRPPAKAIAALTRGMDPDWATRAKCKSADPALFQPTTAGTAKAAKRICRRCKVQDPCLRAGLANVDRVAVLGNTTPKERAPLQYAAACKAFELAEGIGADAAAGRLRVELDVLHRAWDLWGLGRPVPLLQTVAS
jgi:WhiB family transcriptional regulator, redox-sensing transcriptional regulator